MKKIACALIGSGNIGTDLIYKLRRTEHLEPVWMVGIDPESEGLARAKGFGMKTTSDGIQGLLPHLEEDDIQIAFDATSAYVHPEHSELLTARGVTVIDLTPAAIGPLCVPPVNLEAQTKLGAKNVNMISCAGQATIPMVSAVSSVQPVAYAEIIASLASKSVGMGTRKNLDEFVYTTSRALEKVAGAKKGKAVAIVNPAEPPLIMRNTVHCRVEGEPNKKAIDAAVLAMISEVQKYVPGYKLVNGPAYDDDFVSIFLEVAGNGDYFPTYAGNLDIMTAAAARTAEVIAAKMLAPTEVAQ
ncbi:MAG: acetaldehyde dehydrogenase (acetylating) [Deltaproteobacteria bacterium]